MIGNIILHCWYCLTWCQSQHDWLYNITLHIVSIVSHEVKANMIGYIILHCTLLLSHMYCLTWGQSQHDWHIVLSHMRSKPTWLAISYYIACKHCLTWGQNQHDWLYTITLRIVSNVSREEKAHMRSKPTWLAIYNITLQHC